MAYIGVFVALIVCLAPAAWGQEFVVTETQYGYLRGNVLRNVDNGEYMSHIVSYYAVPYAKADRFAKPTRDVTPWSGMRETNWTDAKRCPQNGGGLPEMSEDCLNANIFTPFESSESGPYPVMVWFYGGAFTSGYNLMYPGHFLASRGTVVVSINYRLNHFGFAFTDSDACPGNFGLWDQIAALEFVRDNIAYFGGDPNRVTIFGQSAGAASSGHHSVSPISQNLFHQAIFESGTESNFWSLNWPEQKPETYIWQVSEELGCGVMGESSDQDMIDCLRTKTWQEIFDVRISCTPGHFCQGMAPVVDGPGGILPDRPEILRATGNINKGPMLAGHMHDDGALYTAALIPRSLLGGFNRTEFHKYLNERLLAIWSPQADLVNDTVTMEKAFWAIDYNYAPWPYVEDEYENRDAFNRMITDAAFGYPWDRQMKDHCQYNNIYGYVYNYRGRNAAAAVPEWMGLPHSGGLPQVFGWTLLKLNPHVRTDSGIMDDFIDWTEEDQIQTVFKQTMWTNFVKTGNPTPTPVTNPSPGMPPVTWRPFALDDMAFLHINNVTTEMQTLWRQKDYAFWRDYFIDYIVQDYAIPFSVPGLTNSKPKEKHSAQKSAKQQPLHQSWDDAVARLKLSMASPKNI